MSDAHTPYRGIERDGVDCRHFNGYKPCFPGEDCGTGCLHPAPFGTRVLIVNLDAMGDVLMTTAQLAGIRRRWPVSEVTWLTLRPAAALLAHNPLIDAVVAWDDVGRMLLREQRFDVVLNADKSREACAFTASLVCPDVRGFTLSPYGQVVPANAAADYNYRMGLDDTLKFRLNTRTGQDILAETWELPYERDAYVLQLTAEEDAFCAGMRAAWDLDGRVVVGFNTGCSELFPNKKMTVGQHVRLAVDLLQDPDLVLLLLGGPEDTARNADIEAQVRDAAPPGRLINTPSTEGLRRGICYENLADVVVTGDSFGMHLAIALRKHVLAWFGLSCWQEIDLYDRGTLFPPEGLDCAPCWKKVCPFNLECIHMIDLDAIARHVRAFVQSRRTS